MFVFQYKNVILATASSQNGVLIRLTDERWRHMTTSHKELDPTDFSSIVNAIENPDSILKGDFGELLAVKKKPRKKIWIVVVYKEVNTEDGFVITAYVTTDSHWLFQREVIWSKE